MNFTGTVMARGGAYYLHEKLEEVRLLPACPGHAGSLLRGEGHSLQKLLHFFKEELADCLAKDMRLKPK